MRVRRNILLVLLFLGLMGLEIAHGVSRLDNLQLRHEEELLAGIERRQHDLASGFRPLLASSREHVAYLARLPAVVAALDSPGAPARGTPGLAAQLLSYLVAFRGIDRVRLLDGAGVERFRCERIGNGVGVLPPDLLDAEPERALLELAAGAGEDGVGMSSLVVDHRRVEIPERDRQVLHFAHAVTGTRGERAGAAVITVYANPLLDLVRGFVPLELAESFLVDASGNYLAHSDRARESAYAPASGFARDYPEAAELATAGQGTRTAADAAFIATSVSEQPRWILVTRVPSRVTAEAAAERFQDEYLWVLATIAAITVVLAGAALFLLRLSEREFRLRESQHLLARIARESEKYRALLEGAADMILILDPARGVVSEMNARARKALAAAAPGTAAGDVGLPLAQVFAGADLARAEQGVRDALGAMGPLIAVGDLSVSTREGNAIPVDARFVAMRLGEERVVQVALRDLTRQKEMERQLRVAERLGALGVLTAGVAHEINNPLEGIGNYLALAERQGTPEEKRGQYFAQVRRGLERIRVIVRDLAAFGRPRAEATSADIAGAVRAALGLLEAHADFRGVAVELRGLDEPVWVAGESARLEQVFTNLFLNAARAMNGSGRIFVTASRANGAGPGGAVEVVVEDDGPGIPPENIDRVFDPFFTTGGGSGLGLAICYSIIRIHGGSMSAGNRPEGGARFAVRLPRGEPGTAMERTKGLTA
ncbi:MAG: ATP-binding protein [Planctomycetes bacterium]|nr:ATP-binding protein [Planctomycetota bacterium]